MDSAYRYYARCLVGVYQNMQLAVALRQVMVGRTAMNSYDHLLGVLKEIGVQDIPTREDDDVSEITRRYMLFMNRIGLDARIILDGLLEIICNEGEGQATALWEQKGIK